MFFFLSALLFILSISQYGGEVKHKSKLSSLIFFSSLKLSPFIISIFLSLFFILVFAISQNSFDKSIPTPSLPKSSQATKVEPIPLKGSMILASFFENVLISLLQRATG